MPATDETTQQPQTSISRLAWWRQWWQQWMQSRPRESEQPPEQPPEQPRPDENDDTPTTPATTSDAGFALLHATLYAGTATLYAAYNVKYRGSQDDIAYAEMTAQIALATIAAARAAVPKGGEPPVPRGEEPPERSPWAYAITRYADCAAMSAEATYAALSASRASSSSSLASIAGMLPPRPRAPLPKRLYCDNIESAVDWIVTAATKSAAAAQSAVEAASATPMTTTMVPLMERYIPENYRQVPYDIGDVSRISFAGALAQASAASASVAASALRATHPALAARAARAASVAIAASTRATIMRLTMQEALVPVMNPSQEFHGKNIRKWLTKLELLGSQARLDSNTPDFIGDEVSAASRASTFISEWTTLAEFGRAKVATAESDCAAGMSRKSSATVSASTSDED